MTDQQWERVKEITADAFEQEASTRHLFVENACGGDTEVRSEVLRLLAQSECPERDIFSKPAIVLREFLTDQALPPAPCFETGQLVAGRFEIQGMLGRGSMGEVYAAMDRQLKEPVALKTIHPEIATSARVIEQFKREVSQTRRISNPCVCRVYDLFSHEQPSGEPIWFLTMKRLDGPTLAEALVERKFFAVREALPLIEDMVSALSAAHQLGIVHRDFKPSNVMLVKEGLDRERAVVTDFGLAMDVAKDQARTVDGTPAYMAPEQAAGGRVGLTTDQYALGLVICELLTGERPDLDRFSADSARRQLEHWLGQRRQRINSRVRTVIERCLAFEAGERFGDVGEVIRAAERPERSRRLLWVGAALLLGQVMTVTFFGQGGRLQITDAKPLTAESGLSAAPQITRDGKWVVYTSNRGQANNWDIWIQAVHGGSAKRLTTSPAEDSDPTVSPDGRMIAFRSERDGGGVYVVNKDGGDERLLASGGRNPVFSPDGQWIAYWVGTRDDVAPSAQVYLISSKGGEARRVAADLADARFPSWSSDSRSLLIQGCRADTGSLTGCSDWWAIRLDNGAARDTGALALLRSKKIELPSQLQKSWSRDKVYFSADQAGLQSLWEINISESTGIIGGSPERLTSGDVREREPTVADNGALVFSRVTSAAHVWEVSLRGGTEGQREITDEPEFDACPSASHDGRWLYFTREKRGVRQLFVQDLVSATVNSVESSQDDKYWPVSSPDGSRVAFEVRGAGGSSIWFANRNGLGLRKLCSGCTHPTSWFGEGQVLYTTSTGGIAVVDIVGGRSHDVLSPGDGEILGDADWNDQIKHLLFTVARKGLTKQVFVTPIEQLGTETRSEWIQVTRDMEQVEQPHWSIDGKSFYYLSGRDSFKCIWGQNFSPGSGTSGGAFGVAHYHDLRSSPGRVTALRRGLTVSSNSIFVTVGEVTATLWLGKLSTITVASELWNSLFGS